MKKRDPRVNVRAVNINSYAAVFAVLFAACGIFTAIMYGISNAEGTTTAYIVLSLLTGVVAVSGILMILFYFFHKKFFSARMLTLCDAAKRVAEGDFSVRLSPQRKDGKKDEFEVLYEDFNTMAAELASNEILKSDFISSISHEIKTPVSIIQNYALMLEMDDLDAEERKNCAKKITDATNKLSTLVSGILQLNKLENSNISVKISPFNLSEHIRTCALSFEDIWMEKDIDLFCELDEDITVQSDEKLLAVVWNNLIPNALKFTQSGGSVSITSKKDGTYALITVKDNGCGMEQNVLSHIFDKFYQGDKSRSTEGNGIGLALVKKICDLLNCTVTAQSRQGEGSSFTVRIPL